MQAQVRVLLPKAAAQQVHHLRLTVLRPSLFPASCLFLVLSPLSRFSFKYIALFLDIFVMDYNGFWRFLEDRV